MSDPADKSDDLIAELAKLMAASSGTGQSNPPPVAKAPLDQGSPPVAAPRPATPPPVRIPGMDQPRAAAPAVPTPASAPVPSSAATAAPAPRAPVTGAIRIPGMDMPAPVTASAPVSKFDFGARPAPAAPVKQEPLSTLTERLAPQNPVHRPAPTPVTAAPTSPVRIPSDLRPVSENRSFAKGPAVASSQPTASSSQAAEPGDFDFDFGFSGNPPAVPTNEDRPKPAPEPEHDPIADLIAAEFDDTPDDDAPDEEPEAPPPPRQQVPVTPVVPVPRTVVVSQPVQPKPVMSPVSAQRPAAQPVPLKPVSVAPRAPETDRFAISPGVGLNIKPDAGQPLRPAAPRAAEPAVAPGLPDSDPMSEIESLIGEAVRVELAPPGPVKVQSAPPPLQVEPHFASPRQDDDAMDDDDSDDEPGERTPPPIVPPLGSRFAPRRSSVPRDNSASSAEDAILAAAAATGAEVDRIDPVAGEESPYRRLKVKPARSSWTSGGMRQYVGMAVAGTLLLAAGLGLYWVLNMGRADVASTGENAPVLTADTTPVKEDPPASEVTAETPRSPVLEQMGGATADPSIEQLVSTDQTEGGAVPRDVTAAAATDTDGGLSNRRVRTVTVRPDGTIVSGDDAVAGAATLPVDRPNVPEVPSISGETPSLLADPDSTPAAPAALTPDPAPAASTGPVQLAETGGVQPVFNPNLVAPTPLPVPILSTTPAAARSETVTAFAQEPAPIQLSGAQTPNGQIDLLGGTIETPVASAPVSAARSAAFVQLSSSPSQADAEASLRTLSNRYGSLFGGGQLVVESANLGQRGTWYRVKLPVSSLADGQSVCAGIKASGGDCIVGAQ